MTKGGLMARDESTADDGAIYHFWDYVEAVRARPEPRPFDPDRLDDVVELLRAINAFDDEAAVL
jgi:hypothetical protein